MAASKATTLLVVAAIAVSTAGCDKIKRRLGGEPKGQVVATVGGEEITALELRSELGGFSSKDPKIMKAAQDQALQQIIVRDLLAQRAREQKIDKTPLYTVQVRRGERTLLAQIYESKLFSNVAPPTRKEAETYIANNPDKFANRRIYVVDRVLVAASGTIPKDKIPSIASLEQLKGLLEAQATAYQEVISVVDSLNTSADTLKTMDGLPAGEVFVFQQGNALAFNRIIQTKEAPFRGDVALAFASDQLRKSQAEDFVRSQIIGLRRAAEANISYAKGYKLDNPDLGVSAVKGAPGAPAEATTPGSEAAGGAPPAKK
jgi:EpsD family peptidyl-prolyl cis-trans isomerase